MNRYNVILSDQEIDILANESTRDNYLEIAFGGRLLNIPSNDWAFKRVEEMRDLEDNCYKALEHLFHDATTPISLAEDVNKKVKDYIKYLEDQIKKANTH